MLILKIMSNQDMPDADASKEFKLIADVHSVQFFTDQATTHEEQLLGYKNEGRRRFCTFKMPDGTVEDWVRYLSADYDKYLNTGGTITDHWYQEHPGGGQWPTREEWLMGKYLKSHCALTVSFARVVLADSAGGEREEVHLLTGNCYVLNDRGKTIESFWARRNASGEQVGEK